MPTSPYSANYSSSYGPAMPSSQGPQGASGASGQQNPQQIGAQQYRASMWQPPPGSTQQPGTGKQGQSLGTQGQGTANAAPAANGSPVQSNGMIAQASTPAPQQPAQPHNYLPNTPPAGQDYAVGAPVPGQPGMTYQHEFLTSGGGGWFAAPQGQTQGTPPAQGTAAQPNPALYSPYGPYPGRPDGTVYQPGQAPQYQFQPYQTSQYSQIPQTQMPTYQAGNISQFQAPDQSGLQGQQNALMQQLMANPGWGTDAVNQMKATQKDSALSMQQQQQQQLQQTAAGRGMLNSGFEMGNERRLADTTQQNILNSYRDIDVANAQNTFQNQLGAAAAGENALTGQANRATSFYNTGLQGQQAQESNRQAQAASGQNASQFALQQALAQFGVQQAQAGENQQGFQNQFTAPNFQMQQFLAQQGLNQQGAQSGLAAYNTDLSAFQNYQQNQNASRQLDIQSQLGNAGIGVDQQRLQEQGREFNAGNQLNWAQLMNDMYMGRSNLGYNYAQLQNTAQSQMMSQLFGSMLGGQ